MILSRDRIKFKMQRLQIKCLLVYLIGIDKMDYNVGVSKIYKLIWSIEFSE